MCEMLEDIKEEALEKWKRGLEACADIQAFAKWWCVEGSQGCSFCDAYDCNCCPVGDNETNSCAPQWHRLDEILGGLRYATDDYSMKEITTLVQGMIDKITAC